MNTVTIMGIEFTTMMTKADKVFVCAVGGLAGFSTAKWLMERGESRRYKKMYHELFDASMLLMDAVEKGEALTDTDVEFTTLAMNEILGTNVSRSQTTEQD